MLGAHSPSQSHHALAHSFYRSRDIADEVQLPRIFRHAICRSRQWQGAIGTYVRFSGACAMARYVLALSFEA
jgi:hypothetical protein